MSKRLWSIRAACHFSLRRPHTPRPRPPPLRAAPWLSRLASDAQAQPSPSIAERRLPSLAYRDDLSTSGPTDRTQHPNDGPCCCNASNCDVSDPVRPKVVAPRSPRRATCQSRVLATLPLALPALTLLLAILITAAYSLARDGLRNTWLLLRSRLRSWRDKLRGARLHLHCAPCPRCRRRHCWRRFCAPAEMPTKARHTKIQEGCTRDVHRTAARGRGRHQLLVERTSTPSSRP